MTPLEVFGRNASVIAKHFTIEELCEKFRIARDARQQLVRVGNGNQEAVVFGEWLVKLSWPERLLITETFASLCAEAIRQKRVTAENRRDTLGTANVYTRPAVFSADDHEPTNSGDADIRSDLQSMLESAAEISQTMTAGQSEILVEVSEKIHDDVAKAPAGAKLISFSVASDRHGLQVLASAITIGSLILSLAGGPKFAVLAAELEQRLAPKSREADSAPHGETHCEGEA